MRRTGRKWKTSWKSPVKSADKPGLTATEMFEALADDRLKAIWIINTNPLVSMPDINVAESALKAHFVVVQDVSNRADTVHFADVVLLLAAWLEKEGTMTNAERRIASFYPKPSTPQAKHCLIRKLSGGSLKNGFRKVI
ncbi:molybdopterin-dependent oxidoreductase [Paucibacter sp. O1-1]|nr:molybdopterin-dependent oxidoreductase [Paucibacter sp. O1-1]MDA3830108.1 molybdopterin-dependent oxidoreductase [Paucibacter sp. O1-1]